VKFIRTLTALLAACGAAVALAQPYPNHPIKMVVPFPPGGGFDGIARPFAERLSVALGQPVIVDNRPGAGGNVGTESVARSPADGYTLLFANDFLGTNPNLYKGLKYDPVRDFIPIFTVGSTHMIIAVSIRRRSKQPTRKACGPNRSSEPCSTARPALAPRPTCSVSCTASTPAPKSSMCPTAATARQ
jgi:tripartite-type tricarboxylate transporter receptor subunit TctC